MFKKDKLDLRPKVEHSSSGRYVIRTETMKDPVVRVHVSRGNIPSCDNNHNYENIIDKDKQNRAINSIQRKKNKDKLIEKSRIQLEQTQKELNAANQHDSIQSARKNNSKKIILPKKLVNDITLVNEEIQLFHKEQIRIRYEGELEAEDNKIRKQQRLITKQAVENVNRSMSLINSIQITHDPKEQQKHQQYMKQRVSDINNALWDRQKKLQSLLAHRELVKQKLETIIQNYFLDEESAHLVQINEHVLKFFRVIFGRDYAMRLRMDKILQNNDAENLKRQIEKTKQLKNKVVPSDIFVPYNKSERFKEKSINKTEELFLNSISIGSKTASSQQTADQGMTHKSLNLKLVPLYQAKHLEILENYFHKDVLQHLFDFYFNPVTENLEYDFKSDTWNSLFEQFKTTRLPKFKESSASKKQEGIDEVIESQLEVQSKQTLPPPSQTDISKTPNLFGKSLKTVSSEKQPNSFRNRTLSEDPPIQSEQNTQQSQTDMSINLGSSSTSQMQQNQMYSKEFYQYLREYSLIADNQNKISKDDILRKIEDRLGKCRLKYDFFEGQLDLVDNSHILKKSPYSSPKLRSLMSSKTLLAKNQSEKNIYQAESELISNGKIKTPALSIHNSTKDLEYAQNNSSLPIFIDSTTPTILKSQPHLSNKESTKDFSLPPLLSQSSSKKVNFGVTESRKSIDQVIEQNSPTQQSDSIQHYSSFKQTVKSKSTKSLTQSSNLKKISQETLNQRMINQVNLAASEETSQYLTSINKLYKQCRVESLKTRKVKNESIKKKNIISKEYRHIDKEFKEFASL